jgi:hypothetical protein
MSHGHTRIPTRGVCIYCGRTDVRLTDEHLVPFSLGGQHILEGASCDDCADITKKFEQEVARELWGAPRNSYNAPSRRKKQRDTHIVLSDPDQPDRKVKVPYSEYPAAMVFYKMGKAALLEGLPENIDISSTWLLITIHDDDKAKTFQEKFGIKLTAKFRHVPVSFARMLAKIGYCHLLTELEPGDFRPICLPYILGRKSNPSYVVGGNLEIAPPESVGYILRTAGFGTSERLMLIAEIRLFSNNSTPTYHVVVGDVSGQQQVASVLEKIGPHAHIGEISASASDKDGHWAPRVWPLPFWNAA